MPNLENYRFYPFVYVTLCVCIDHKLDEYDVPVRRAVDVRVLTEVTHRRRIHRWLVASVSTIDQICACQL